VSSPCRVQEERFHSLLASLYLEQVFSLLGRSAPAGPPGEQLSRARARLQALLRESNLYLVQPLLGPCTHTPHSHTLPESHIRCKV